MLRFTTYRLVVGIQAGPLVSAIYELASRCLASLARRISVQSKYDRSHQGSFFRGTT